MKNKICVYAKIRVENQTKNSCVYTIMRVALNKNKFELKSLIYIAILTLGASLFNMNYATAQTINPNNQIQKTEISNVHTTPDGDKIVSFKNQEQADEFWERLEKGSAFKSSADLPSNPQHPMYGLNHYVPAHDMDYATNTDWYGSGDIDGNGIIDWDDYNSSITGNNPFYDETHRGDTDLDGVSGTVSDKAIILDYINGNRTHINKWELETLEEKRNHLTRALTIDPTDKIPYNANGGWLCYNFSDQTYINLNGVYEIENSIFAQDNNTNLQYDLSHNGLFRIPLRVVSTVTPGGAHSINNVYLGSPENQDAKEFEDRIYDEPQTDVIQNIGDYSLNQKANEKWYGYYNNSFLNQWMYSSFPLVNCSLDGGNPIMTYKNSNLVISWNPMEEVETPSDQEIEYYSGIENDYGTLADGVNNLYPGTLEEKVFSSGQVNDASIDQVNYDVGVSHELTAGAYNPQNTVDAIKGHTLRIRDTTPPVESYFPADTLVDKDQVQNAIGNPVYSDNSELPVTHNYSIELDNSTSEYNRWIVNHTGTDITGNSVTSPQYITEKLNVGIDEPNESKILIYPNPAKEFIVLNWDTFPIFEKPYSCSLKITDLTGKVVFEKEISKGHFVINTSKYHKGVYLLYIYDGRKPALQQKIIIR